MRLWLFSELPTMVDGDVVEIGPRDADEDDTVVDVAEVTAVGGGWAVRLSRSALPDFVEVEVAEAVPDRWHDDPVATDGLLFTRDAALAADLVTDWFSTRVQVESPSALGVAYFDACSDA